MSAPVLDHADGNSSTPQPSLGRRLVTAIAGCYLLMDPVVTEVWATPGVLSLREREPQQAA